MKLKKSLVLAAAVAAVVAAPGAFATNGMFDIGFGTKAKGMGGAGVALPQDALAAATNPAGMVLVGNRIDAGISLFRPDRATSISGNTTAANNIDYDANGDESFFIPEFGYNKMISSTMSFGVSVYGNGGMNTSYSRNVTLFGSSPAGINLTQLFIAPTVAWKLSDTNAIGVSLNIARETVSVQGLENFNSTNYSTNVGSVTNRGEDSGTGLGLRIGWIGQVSPNVTLGATYQTKTNISKFNKYSGTFAEQGDIDVPANYAIGLAVKASPKTVVAFDVEKIQYTGVKSISNPLGMLSTGLLASNLGNSDGAGFGWQDMTVYKLGVAHQVNDKLTVRAGWNYGKQPIPAKETFFNLLAPAVVEHHLTLGATWNYSKDMEMSANYMHAFSNELKGSGSIPAASFGNGEANLRMQQTAIGIALGWKM